MSDIIERLHGPDGMEAGREILRLREENARLHKQAEMNGRLLTENAELREEIQKLRGALKPFAEVAKHYIGEDETDGDRFRPMITHNRAPHLNVGHLRVAAAAIREGGRDETL